MAVAESGRHDGGMAGRQLFARVRRWARRRGLEVRFAASEGPGSHGTLYAGDRETTVKDRRKESGKGLARMPTARKIGRLDFRSTRAGDE